MIYEAPYYTELGAALDYDFMAETRPGVWRVYHRITKAEYLAHDITDMLYWDPERPHPDGRTENWDLLRPDLEDGIMSKITQLWDHENLVSLIEVIKVHKTNFGGAPGRERWFAIWELCDAGILENYFIPNPYNGPRVTDAEEQTAADAMKLTLTKFLPESLVWHVACSLLKALAWLHNGTTALEWNEDLGRFVEMGPWDPDWHMILHRNISPENIFFQHPRRSETYGLCKLGNPGAAFVSGHVAVRADVENEKRRGLPPPQGPHGRYVGAPPQGENFRPLEELRERDWQYKDSHPPMDDQPYTLVSEYRALGELLQAMMVKPEYNGSFHMTTIRSRSVRDNLRLADYSLELRTFVQCLMEMSLSELLEMLEQGTGWVRDKDHGPLITHCTGGLYARAISHYYHFRETSANVEDRQIVMRGEEVQREAAEDAAREKKHRDLEDLRDYILDEQDRLFGIPLTNYNGKRKRDPNSG